METVLIDSHRTPWQELLFSRGSQPGGHTAMMKHTICIPGSNPGFETNPKARSSRPLTLERKPDFEHAIEFGSSLASVHGV